MRMRVPLAQHLGWPGYQLDGFAAVHHALSPFGARPTARDGAADDAVAQIDEPKVLVTL
jgi:hypothetical protein